MGEKTYFLKKSSGSGSESVIQWYGSPDPDQNVTDPEHWLEAEMETEEKKQKEKQRKYVPQTKDSLRLWQNSIAKAR